MIGYEEMAEGWACDTGCLCNMHRDDLVEALRAAAREAQIQALQSVMDFMKNNRKSVIGLNQLAGLKARLENGDDI